jgi:hypothetical protein
MMAVHLKIAAQADLSLLRHVIIPMVSCTLLACIHSCQTEYKPHSRSPQVVLPFDIMKGRHVHLVIRPSIIMANNSLLQK